MIGDRFKLDAAANKCQHVNQYEVLMSNELLEYYLLM